MMTYSSCYLTALKIGQFKPKNQIPLLTDLSSQMPERIIFAIGLSIASLLQLTVVLTRYLQIATFRQTPFCPLMNGTGCIFGCLMVLGQMLLTSVRHFDAAWVHYLGKAIQFSAACVYMGTQSYISMHMTHYHTKCFAYFRCILTVLSATCPFVLIVGLSINTLNGMGVPQLTEIALLLFIIIFWMTIAVDFNKNKIDVFRGYSKGRPRIQHRLSCRGGDNHGIITYLNDVTNDYESPELIRTVV